MLCNNYIKKILNVKYTAIDKTVFEDDTFIIQVHATKGHQCRCGICGRKCKVYDSGNYGARTWRACDWSTYKVILVAPSCRVRCPEHGVVTCQFPWARHNSGFTYDFEQITAWLAVNCSKVAVSEFMRISWGTVGAIVKRVNDALDTDPEKRFNNLFRIGVDETSYKKGHKYITTVINHDTGKVIWASEGHGKSVFSSFFDQLTEEQRANIQLVSGDGAKWIDECIKEYCPNAERCVDPFHVISWAMEALDDMRVDTWRSIKKEVALCKRPAKRGRKPKDTPKTIDVAKEIKTSKLILGKSMEKLTSRQADKIDWISKTDPKLFRAYKLKEALRYVFHSDTAEEAEEKLDAWIKWARHCRLPKFVELQKKINRHRKSILNTIKYHLSNARVEAINNKIKLSIRMAYGFRNIDNMLAMIMLRCSGIDVRLPWN